MKSDTLLSLMLEVGAQLGHDRIVSKIGAGVMGEVYFGVRKIRKGSSWRERMFGDEESVFDRLWSMITDKFAFIFPLRIIKRPETLTILDYRPTFTMFLTVAGLVVLAVSFVLLFFKIDNAIVSGLWMIAIPLLICVVFLFRGTIREVYYFDRTKDSYVFVRQFIHRREVIEGALSQFTGAYVKTEKNDESESYFVVLKQEGMFLTGANEQNLREELPVFNSFEREARIANAISGFLPSKR